MRDIKKSDILRFYNGLLSEELKYSTIKYYNCIIFPCLELAVDDDIIRKNPCKGCLQEFSNNASERISLTEKEREKTDVEIDGYSDFVFSTKNKNPIMPSAVNNMLLNVVNRYNRSNDAMEKLPHISAHNLRHTGCTRMAEAGVDPKVLQYIMGHSKISVTMEVYNHVSSERSRKEINKLEKIRLIG